MLCGSPRPVCPQNHSLPFPCSSLLAGGLLPVAYAFQPSLPTASTWVWPVGGTDGRLEPGWVSSSLCIGQPQQPLDRPLVGSSYTLPSLYPSSPGVVVPPMWMNMVDYPAFPCLASQLFHTSVTTSLH